MGNLSDFCKGKSNCMNFDDKNNQLTCGDDEIYNYFNSIVRNDDTEEDQEMYIDEESNGGNSVDREALMNFDEKLLAIGEFVDDSLLDDVIKTHIYESELILQKFKNHPRFNKNWFGFTIAKPLVALNFDLSFYKGQWSLDLKRTGYGISIKSDGSKYQGTWFNDNINGVGRFTNINGNYYEGNILNQILNNK